MSETFEIRPVNTTYEPFSQEPEYLAMNEAFMSGFDLPPGGHLLDLACGTGLMAELARRRRPDLRVVGADLSLESLRIARRSCQERGETPAEYVRCTADQLPVRSGRFDACTMGNSIHMVLARDALLAEVARALKPGARFGFNTSFYAGTFAEGTAAFYHDWVKFALQYLLRKSERLCAEGGRPIARRRGKGRAALQTPWYSPDEWGRALEAAGFAVEYRGTRVVDLRASSFRAIGSYGGFSQVLLSGYPVEESSEALQATAEEALAAHGREVVPRYWLELIARRA